MNGSRRFLSLNTLQRHIEAFLLDECQTRRNIKSAVLIIISIEYTFSWMSNAIYDIIITTKLFLVAGSVLKKGLSRNPIIQGLLHLL